MGFTLTEVLAVVGIIAVVGFLLFSVVGRMAGAGDRAKCTANLRVLYIGLDAATQDKGKWPQAPEFSQAQEAERGRWWVRTLKDYDVPESAWKCPGVTRLGAITKGGSSPVIHYSPTQFDDLPRTPYKWATMPWLIEIGNTHGKGALMIFPDGSVRDMESVLLEQGL